MNNINIQWISQDPNLFELDWLAEILGVTEEQIKIVRTADQFLDDKNSLIICNQAILDYRLLLDKIKSKGLKYAIFLLSDENLREPCEWLHDPSCLFSIRNYVHPYFLGHPKVKTLGLGYKRGLTKNLKDVRADEREYLWSFAGTPHGGRKDMIKIFKPLEKYKVHYTSGFGAEDGMSVEDYSKMLQQSVFALCPGGQDSMDTFRLYEALEAGCIPVTLNRTERLPIYPSYWHGVFNETETMPFISSDSWEENLDKVKQIEDYTKKQQECKTFWNEYKVKWRNELKSYISSL